MKRSAALLQLSREHHSALSLALAAKRAVASGDPGLLSILSKRVVQAFADELEAHFQEEETTLLPRLAAVGETALVARTLAEHAELRALAGRLRRPDADALHRFAVLLTAHVRFEERELFAAAESHWPGDVLAVAA